MKQTTTKGTRARPESFRYFGHRLHLNSIPLIYASTFLNFLSIPFLSMNCVLVFALYTVNQINTDLVKLNATSTLQELNFVH